MKFKIRIQMISIVIGNVRNAEEFAFPCSFSENFTKLLGIRKHIVGSATAHITMTVTISTLKYVSPSVRDPIIERI
jgi:hypothetical protein